MWDCWCSWRGRGSTIRYSEPGSARRFILKNLASLQNITRRILSIDVFDQNRTMPMPNQKQIRAKYVAASNLNTIEAQTKSRFEPSHDLRTSAVSLRDVMYN